jgi:O-succinylbenzoate synthase
MAKASFEIALWDLLGKQQSKPLSVLLGGQRAAVEVGVSVGIQDSPQALVQTVGGYLDQGYARIKIKIKPGRDTAEAQAVRQAFPHIRLQVDANSAYTLENAAALLPLDELDLLLIEQPLAEDDIGITPACSRASKPPYAWMNPSCPAGMPARRWKWVHAASSISKPGGWAG